MNRDRLSRIGHAELDVMSPVPADALEGLLDLAGIVPGDRAVDIGAGKGAVARLAVKRGAHVSLVERSPLFAALAREALAAAGLSGSAEVHERDARDFLEERALSRGAAEGEDAPAPRTAPFRLAICIGASHALGGRDAALSLLAQSVSKGGHVLFGEGYWRRPPSPDYLAVLGASPEDFGTLDDNVAAAARGLVLRATETAEGERFDRYERGWCGSLARFAAEHPDDPDANEVRAIAASRLEAYEKWGREQLGFAVHLFVRG